MTPPRPNGSTTVLTMPQRVDPSAYAASRSPCGAWEKTSRDSEVMIGMAISDTTMRGDGTASRRSSTRLAGP